MRFGQLFDRSTDIPIPGLEEHLFDPGFDSGADHDPAHVIRYFRFWHLGYDSKIKS